MTRAQLYLAGLLLVQVVLILVFRSPLSGATTGSEARPLLPVLDAITPNRIEILGEDDASIRLVKRDGEWRVEAEDLDGFPADAAKIDGLLGDLQDIRVRRPVVSSARYHEAFQVTEDENEARLRMWDETGDEPDVDLILGSSPNFRTSHVRLAERDEVYQARGVSPYDLRPMPNSWIERDFVPVDEASVVGLTLTNASGGFELAKEAEGWKVLAPADREGVAVDPEQVASLVRQATSLRLSEATGAVDRARHGFDEPAAKLVLRLAEEAEPAGGELTLLIGGTPEDEESQRYVTREGFGFTGIVWESSVRRLLEDGLDDLEAS